MSKRLIALSVILLLIMGGLAYGSYWYGANKEPLPQQKKATATPKEYQSIFDDEWRWGDDSGHNVNCSITREEYANPYNKWAYDQRCPGQAPVEPEVIYTQPRYTPPQDNSFRCTSSTYGTYFPTTYTNCY